MLEFKFPDIGEGIAEGILLDWLVEVGQEVKEGDSLFLVETDKVNAEIPSPRNGIILARFGEVGDTIHVGDVIVTIGDASATLNQPMVEEIEEENAGVVGALEMSSHVLEASRETSQISKALATPATRQLAKNLGININEVKSSEPDGRVSKEDVRKFMPRTSLEPTPSPDSLVPGSSRQGALEERVGLTTLGKTVAKNMALSKQEIPHAAIMDEFDVTELVKLRNDTKELADKEGAKLTYMPFVIKAIALALQEYPHFNASFSPETQEIIVKKYYNIGIAVDTPHGLLVPVIKNAQGLGLLSLAKAVQRLAEKARDQVLGLDDIQGGTFTLTNYGAVGALSGLPVIKYPEAAILGIGTITKKPMVNANEEIVIRHILPVTLAFDHRFIDGGLAGRFIQRLKQYLQEPLLLLLS